MLSKKLTAVDKTRCVACGVCENTCPLGAVRVRRGCYAAVEAERCVGCGKCVFILLVTLANAAGALLISTITADMINIAVEGRHMDCDPQRWDAYERQPDPRHVPGLFPVHEHVQRTDHRAFLYDKLSAIGAGLHGAGI